MSAETLACGRGSGVAGPFSPIPSISLALLGARVISNIAAHGRWPIVVHAASPRMEAREARPTAHNRSMTRLTGSSAVCLPFPFGE